MPKVNATIDTVGEANTENQRTATFSPGNGNPAWTEVKNNGDIDLSKQGAQPNVDIVFTLPTGFTFSATAPFSPVSGDFEVVSGAGTAVLTVSDTNNETNKTDIEYTLTLSDATSIDPKVINR